MPTQCKPLLFAFQGCGNRRVTAAFDGGAITSNAGVLLLREIDRSIGLVDRVAGCFTDYRDRRLTEHSVQTLVRQRVMGLALGYEDLNDHDELRHDPVLALLSGKLEAHRKDCAPLAGKSTLNRLEHAPPKDAPGRYHRIGHDADALQAVLLESFIDSWADSRPSRLVLDIDSTDDEVHGRQEGRFYHGMGRASRSGSRSRPGGRSAEPRRLLGCRGETLTSRVPASSARVGLDRLRARLLPPGRHGEHDQGAAARSLLRPHLGVALRRQPAPALFSAFASILFAALRRALHGTRLARATAATLRLKLLKIGARLTVSVRRVKVAMDSAHPSASAFARIHARLPG